MSLTSGKIKLLDLYPRAFMAKHTKCESLDDFFKNSGFSYETEEQIEEIPEQEWDDYVRANSSFNSWEEMQKLAVGEYMRRKLHK